MHIYVKDLLLKTMNLLHFPSLHDSIYYDITISSSSKIVHAGNLEALTIKINLRSNHFICHFVS